MKSFTKCTIGFAFNFVFMYLAYYMAELYLLPLALFFALVSIFFLAYAIIQGMKEN